MTTTTAHANCDSWFGCDECAAADNARFEAEAQARRLELVAAGHNFEDIWGCTCSVCQYELDQQNQADEQTEMEPVARAFCDNDEVHESHTYWAINHQSYTCPGFTAEDLVKLEAEAALPPCEHGLSASLCAGPGHYPMDDRY